MEKSSAGKKNDAMLRFGLAPQTRNLGGQAALDFLMTYGWALLLIMIIVGGLFALGIFDSGNFIGSRSTGFVQIGALGWRIAPDGNFTLMLKNNAGTDVNITAINSTLYQSTQNYPTPIPLQNGASTGQVVVGNFGELPSGQSYSVRVSITYVDAVTGFQYQDSGSVNGRVN
jgi:hypothetical protein